MKQTINYYAFEQAFRDHDRYDQFGRAALRALLDYIEELEEDIGEETELDVIALCCDWTRYDSAVDTCTGYDTDIADPNDEEQCLEWLQDQTQVIETGNGTEILVLAF